MKRRKLLHGWQRLYIAVMVPCLAVSLCACGRADKGESGTNKYFAAQGEQSQEYTDEEDYDFIDDSEASGVNAAEDETVAAEAEEGNTAKGDTVETAKEKVEGSQAANTQTVSKEMLVYRGRIEIDTLQFDRSVEDFKQLLDQAGGFVEKENYSDKGERYGEYYAVEEEEKHNSYTATIRVPSAQYNTVMDGAGSLGDVRSKTSNVQNVTQQYSTYQSQIKIYEAEYQRYLKLLEKASEDQYALEIEQKLFDLQVKIAEIKSGITNLETDVAFSYIDVTLTEVQKYQEHPEKKDTFLDRLIHTCKNSMKVFLFLLESILFCIIYTWYYIAIILLILYVIFKI
ncbi:MAG: DUF4349 domain-containing protein, partial [Lachnospiraceae bacterium]|nr:DUF4349 domain-containing protein [Lachnospiraceae bacterium]